MAPNGLARLRRPDQNAVSEHAFAPRRPPKCWRVKRLLWRLFIQWNNFTVDVFIGKPASGQLDQWVVETRGGAGQVSTGKPVVQGQTTLLVLKADFRPGPDTFSLLINPQLPAGEPNAYDAVKNDLDLDQLSAVIIYSTGEFSVDEIRYGESYADVTPVPEPGSMALLATVVILAGGILAGRRLSS
jgi:hypothetical protein